MPWHPSAGALHRERLILLAYFALRTKPDWPGGPGLPWTPADLPKATEVQTRISGCVWNRPDLEAEDLCWPGTCPGDFR